MASNDRASSAATPSQATRRKLNTRRAWVMVGILSALYVVSFADRFILGLLVQPLKADLGVSDVQLGLLFGTAFGLIYGILAIPIARLADRGNRVLLILCGVILWSLCTISSGFASSFAVLVLLRIGLAVGEATLTPAAYSLIGDTMPARSRGIAATLYNAVGMFGASGAYIIGAAVIAWVDAVGVGGAIGGFRTWQIVFLIVGTPGLVLAAAFALVAREPARAVPNVAARASFMDVMRDMASKGWLYFGLFLGAGAAQLANTAFIAWSPTYLSRRFDMTTGDAGSAFGLYNLVSTVGGTLLIPLLGHWLGRFRADGPVLMSIGGVALGGVICAVAVTQNSPQEFLGWTMVGLFLTVGSANNILSSIHLITPGATRATYVSLFLICMNTLAFSIAPPLVAIVAAFAGPGPDGLAIGVGAVSVTGAMLATILFLAARPRFVSYLAQQRDL